MRADDAFTVCTIYTNELEERDSRDANTIESLIDAGTLLVSSVIVSCVATSIPCSWWAPWPSSIRITVSYVRVGVPSRRRWRASLVRVVAIRFSSRRRWGVWVPSWWRASSVVSSTIVIVRSSTRRALPVVTTRAVATRRWTATVVVLICARCSISATGWRALTIAFVHRTLVLNLWVEVHKQIVRVADVDRDSSTNVLGAVDDCTLELTAVKLLYCGFQVGTVFEFDEAKRVVALASTFATEMEWLTLCHRGRDQSQSRQHQLELGEQSLSDPASKVSCIPERFKSINKFWDTSLWIGQLETQSSFCPRIRRFRTKLFTVTVPQRSSLARHEG